MKLFKVYDIAMRSKKKWIVEYIKILSGICHNNNKSEINKIKN